MKKIKVLIKDWRFICSGAAIFTAILIWFVISSRSNAGIIKYNVKYSSGDNYVIFAKDGTCKRSTNVTSCEYEANANEVVVTTKQPDAIVGTHVLVMYFRIKDIDNLEHYKSIVNGIDFENYNLTIYSTKGLTNQNDENKSDDTSSNNVTKAYYQKYNLVTTTSGKKATIEFLSGNRCLVDFSNFNSQSSGVKNYMRVDYTSGSCSYEENEGEKTLEISYLGTYEVSNYYYHDYFKSMQKAVVSSSYVMKKAIIKFSEDYETFKYQNGEFKYLTGEFSYVYFLDNSQAKPNEESEENNSSSSNNNETNNPSNNSSNNSDNVSNNNPNNNSTDSGSNETPTKKTDKELALEALEKVTITLKHRYEDSYTLTLNASNEYNYTLVIGNDTYTDTLLNLKYEKVGENCLDIKITDNYDNSKTINKCITFSVETPNYDIRFRKLISACQIEFWEIGEYESYNAYKNLSCTLDGVKGTCLSYSGSSVSKGNHTMIFTNKFGLSQTVNFTCNP